MVLQTLFSNTLVLYPLKQVIGTKLYKFHFMMSAKDWFALL